LLFARNQEADTPADGVVTGVGSVGGRTVCIMANDYTVKAGSWGEKTVAKIVRIQERAQRLQAPLLYLVDAAGGPHLGADQDLPRALPRRAHLLQRGAALGSRPSGVHPLRALAGRVGYLPALTDCVIMVDGKASLYVGSPRMVEMAIGEKVSLEDLGGARMHCSVSGCGDILAAPTKRPSSSASGTWTHAPVLPRAPREH
jgi:acetyl-CoA carboxylase carboxyltransferase component